MTTPGISRIKKRIISVLKVHALVSPSRTRGLLKMKDLIGKLYEAEVLATTCENLVTKENLQLSLIGGGYLNLKQKGGIINRHFPYFKVWKKGNLFAEIFTDIYFSTISSQRKTTSGATHGDYHELDIVVIKPGVANMPMPEEILIAVECKNTVLRKNIMRELLGYRRELSFLYFAKKTAFTNWPIANINADPSSIHMLYINHDHNIQQYSDNFDVFGIILVYHPM